MSADACLMPLIDLSLDRAGSQCCCQPEVLQLREPGQGLGAAETFPSTYADV